MARLEVVSDARARRFLRSMIVAALIALAAVATARLLADGAAVTQLGNLRYRRLRMESGAAGDGRLDRLPEHGSATAVTDNVELPRAQGGET